MPASEHPLARAIVKHARGQGLVVKAAENLQIVAGKGATGSWGGPSGSGRMLHERGQADDEVTRRIAELSVTTSTSAG